MTSDKIGEQGEETGQHPAMNGDGAKNGTALAQMLPGEQDIDYRQLFENAPVGYFVLTEDGTIAHANLTGAKHLGVEHNRLPGSNFEEYLAPSEAEHFRKHRQKVLASSSTRTCQVEVAPRLAGRTCCLHLQSRIATDDRGTRFCYVATTDVTERRKREEAERFLSDATGTLAQSIDYHTTLAQLARMCVPILGDWCTVFIHERDGSIERLAMAHADPIKEEIAQELQHRYPPGRDNPFAIPVLRGESVLIPHLTSEIFYSTTQSEEHRQIVERLGPTSMMVVPLMLHGRVLGALSLMATGEHPPYTMEDVELATRLADRAAMPVENARLYWEAQEAVKARDEFLSIASHELRTPLTSLTLQLQGLLKTIQMEGLHHIPQDRLKRRLDGASEQVQRMSDLVNRLLDVSRITAGRVELDIDDVNLAGLVGEVLDRFEAELRAGKYHLTFDLLDRPVVRADRFRLDQVLTNLLSNALKYGRGNPIRVTIDCKNGKAILSVEDCGIGISPENQERIFERFERAATSSSVTGLGLGLYISKRLIETMGGNIFVSSQVDVGSCFTIELPSVD